MAAIPTTEEVLLANQRRDADAREARRNQIDRAADRGEGLRIRLSKIPGVTKGDAAKVLKVPYFFQCPPLEEFAVPKQRQAGRYNNYKGTEYSTRSGKQLDVLTFRTIVVEYGRFVVERDFDVQKLVKNLQRLVDSGWPVELLATHSYNDEPEVHMNVLLESANVVENAGENDSRYVDLSFSQWRDATAANKRLGSELWPKTATIDKHGTLTVVKGSKTLHIKTATLSEVAKACYGKPSQALHIGLSQKPPLRWGVHTQLIKAARYKGKGGKLLIPEPPPKASINPPDRGE